MPKVYGYARVSFLDEKKNRQRGHEGLSIDAQVSRVMSYITYHSATGGALANAQLAITGWRGLRSEGEASTDGFYVDRDVSAYRKPFLTRPAGRRLSAVLEPGDSVVFSRLDRAFRNVRDAVTVVDVWQGRNIGIHFLDPQVDLTTAHGRAFMQMSAVWAEFASALAGERMGEIHAQIRDQGRRPNRFTTFGWKCHANSLTPQPDYEERAILSWIIYLRDEKRMSWRDLADHVEATLAALENRKPVPRFQGEGARRFGFNRCIRGYKAAKQDLGLSAVGPDLILPRRVAVAQ